MFAPRHYEVYGRSKRALAQPKVLQAAADIGTAVGSTLFFGAKGLYDTFNSKNKMLATNTMPVRRTYRRTRRSSKKTQYKRTKSNKRRPRVKRAPKSSLRKEVKQIKKQLNADSARHVYKSLSSSSLGCAVNSSNYQTNDICTGTQIESFMANLRYYDPAAPGTLVTAAGGTGTYQREIHFKNVHGALEIRNNYQIPVKVKVYLVQPKGDTGITSTTYYNNSIADQLIGGTGTITTNGIYPTELTAFMAQWKVKCLKDVTLDAGATITATHNTGPFRYDPSLFDSHSLEYQNKFKSASFFIRVEGVPSHDTAAAQYTTSTSQVDIMMTIRAEIIYDAGVVLDDIYLINGRASSFTNGGVVTNKPIADNQAWSQA